MRHDVIAWPVRVKPPAGTPWSVTDDDRRRQTPATVTRLVPYTIMRRRAINKNLSYHTGTAWGSKSVEMLSTATQLYEILHMNKRAINEWLWKSLKVKWTGAMQSALGRHQFLKENCSEKIKATHTQEFEAKLYANNNLICKINVW